ncbi:STAS domain-containing protein [Chlorobium phaeobacteroides]|uniref:Anti-sigma-factor antagonist n=1 Tax=Chlorobium phaeobacteroides (strain DSM 266 / SMG 266 / 2430) TaxID=290317 RepID=A1BHG8_CHLPD|nr:STAS domain-containing protein [Chlorobium phaeobacteroides]ABL65845.1 anti-sigma-factor antagonist [Chlorobium phaeobacteroides DSM 266]
MKFRVETLSGKNIGIAELSGRLDAENSGALQTSFALWQKQAVFFVFDCINLEFVDSSGLGAIVACLRKALEHNGDVRLAALGPKVSMVFDLTKAKKLFSIFPDTSGAIQSFGTGGAA